MKLPQLRLPFILTKRQKFIAATALLLLEIIILRWFPLAEIPWRVRASVFAITSVVATYLAIWDEDFNGIELITLPILPVFFATGAVLIYPLLPQRLDYFFTTPVSPDTSILLSLVVKIVFLSIFAVGYYASLLAANIFNVAAVRNIQLLRVAHSIGFLVTVTSALFFFMVLGSFHYSSWINFGAVFVVSSILAFQLLWSVGIEKRIDPKVGYWTFLTAFVLSETAWILSFWPISVSIFALFLTAIFYELTGIGQYHLDGRLSSRVVNEFVLVAVIIFLLTIMTTSWSG